MSERETAQLRDQTMNYLRSNTWLTNGRYRSRPESQTQLIRSACLTALAKRTIGNAFASHDPDRSISHNSRLVPLDLTSQHPNPGETEMIVAVCKISHPLVALNISPFSSLHPIVGLTCFPLASGAVGMWLL